jgi:predicted PurR-regulated permease PerM
LPFLIAWIISILIRPLAAKLSRRTHLPQTLCAVILLIALVVGVFLLVFFTVHRLLAELGHLFDRLLAGGADLEATLDRAVAFLQSIGERFGLVRLWGDGVTGEVLREQLDAWIGAQTDRLLTTLVSRIPRMVGGLLAALPNLFLVTVVTAISGVYFCMDGERITEALISCLPEGVRRRIPSWRAGVRRISWRYLRAYLFLTLLTFAELFLGFSILRVDYAFLLALIVALVDLLPILGVGTVLLPWAAVMLLRRNFYLGVGLLIL